MKSMPEIVELQSLQRECEEECEEVEEQLYHSEDDSPKDESSSSVSEKSRPFPFIVILLYAI
jgi:hypothetical protein